MIGPPDCFECAGAPDVDTLPHAVLMGKDDAGAIELARRVGLLDDLLLNVPERNSITLAITFLHPTHWIAVARFQNYPQAIDNGYATLLMPRSHWSREEFREIAMTHLGPDTGKVRLIIARD